MKDLSSLALAVVVVTVLIAVLMGGITLLIALNNNRRIRYQAELAAIAHRHEREVMAAEREATRHALQEVGAELHDNVGQLLSVAQVALHRMLDEPAPDERLGAAAESLRQGIEELRRLAHGLNSDLWRGRSLTEAVADTGSRIERATRIEVPLRVSGEWPTMPEGSTTILYRVIQEALQNAVRHGRARRIAIDFDAGPPAAVVIADDGRGFDPASTAESNGIGTIRRRCALIGFSAECRSAPGQGTTWTFQQLSNDGA